MICEIRLVRLHRRGRVLYRQPTGPSPPHRLDDLADRPCAMGVLNSLFHVASCLPPPQVPGLRRLSGEGDRKALGSLVGCLPRHVRTGTAIAGKLGRFTEKTFQEFVPGSFRWTGCMSRPGTKFSISENISR